MAVMGIRGLAGWIAWAAPHSYTSPNWDSWKGKTIGVDILGFLYKAKSQKVDPIVYLGSILAAAKHAGIRLLPVFDGKPPANKHTTIAQRSASKSALEVTKAALLDDLKRVPMTEDRKTVLECKVRALDSATNYLSSEERNRAKQLCYACGVLPLNACGEADSVLAYFMKTNMIQGIMSHDYDYLARGVETLLVPEGLVVPGGTFCWKQYSLSTLLQSVKFTYIQFVEMCVLMGCDYTYGAISLPYKSAYWAIKYRGAIGNTLRHLHVHDVSQYKQAYATLVNSVTRTELMGEKQWEKLVDWAGSPEPEALAAFRSCELATLSESEYTLLCSDR